MKFILTILLILTCSIGSYAQTFSNEREKFSKELQKLLTEYGNDYVKFIKDEFSVMLLEGSQISDERFTNLVATSNLITSKRFGVYPEVYNYIYSIYSLVKSKQSDVSYKAYQNTINQLLNSRNPRSFSDFSESASGFFARRSLSKSSNFEWFYEGGKYEFTYENNRPLIQLSEGDLICRINDVSRSGKYIDSIKIYQITGTYDPTRQKWEGSGGKITWEKVGLAKAETYALLKHSELSLKNTYINADSAQLKTPYFDQLLVGKLAGKAFKINRDLDRVYPQFTSYNTHLKIKDILPNIDYEGPFTLKGSSFIGLGVKNEPAKITIFKADLPFVEVSSNLIQITDKDIMSNQSNIKISLNSGDSIIHPSANFHYLVKEKTIELSRTSSGLGEAPFQDSYHQLYYYVPLLVIKENENKIDFTYQKGTSQEQKLARFESYNFFDERLYDRLQGMSAVHPLVAISKYCYKYDKYEISEGECATALGSTISQAKSLMLQLAALGFINYDTENKKVSVNQKLNNFVKGKAGDKDYDNLILVTDFRPKSLSKYTEEEIQKTPYLQEIQKKYTIENEKRRLLDNFGTFNLGTMEMSLAGVDRITLSDKQNVQLFPDGGSIIVKENRDIDFKGWINAGKSEIYAENSNYNYEENKIYLVKTTTTLFRVSPRDQSHGRQGIPMNTAINNIKGTIAIDLPTNRSGNTNNPITARYPVLKVNNPSNVYYNQKSLFNGVYDSTRFYYTIEPFTLDSIDNFNDIAWRLKGKLISAGIFPEIHEDLKIMPDYSFGFSTESPSGGFDFYGTGAKYENKVLLSGNGLQGAGTINFIKSTSVSKELFTFLPDSTVGMVTFVNQPVTSGIEFPQAKSDEAYMTYVPKKKILKAYSTRNSPISMFETEANLDGVAFITPKGMRGKGLIDLKGAEVISQDFDFKNQDILADTSSFRLKNKYKEADESNLVFETNNVKAEISFEERKGNFYSNNGESEVYFPVNQYMCKMDLFTWFMDQDEIAMQKKSEADIDISTGVDLVGPNFFSTHPKQDSLQFRAPKAKYDIKEKTIFCNEVEYIDVADARIYPDSMKLVVRKKAKMDPLDNAKIIANYITKYHTFTDAHVEIKARRDYEATGQYPYYDKDSTATYITMNKISLDTSYQTVATGDVAKEMNFKLSPEFDYYGKLTVKAASPEIMFDGATRIYHDCSNFERNWLAFSSNVDPKNIQIPVGQSKVNLHGEPIAAGIVWRNSNNVDSIMLYPTFLSKMVDKTDPIVVTSQGYLTYDYSTNDYQIASKEKLINRSIKGNFISLNTKTCSLFGEGEIKLGMDHGDVDIKTIGTADYNNKNGETSFNLTAKIELPVDKSIFKDLADKINEVQGLKPMDFVSNTLQNAVTNWATQKESDKLVEDFTINGSVKKIPKELESTLTITGLKMNYYSKPSLNNFKGLITTTKSAVLVNIYDKPIMKYVPFEAFFQQKYSEAGGDWFAFLLDVPGANNYFFNYSMGKKEGVLDIITNDTEMSTTISEMKETKRKKNNFLFQIGKGGLKTVFSNLFLE